MERHVPPGCRGRYDPYLIIYIFPNWLKSSNTQKLSFVFTPYIFNDVFASTVLHKCPVLYIGNRVGSEYCHPMGRELARRYIRKAYVTGDHTFGPEMLEFIRADKCLPRLLRETRSRRPARSGAQCVVAVFYNLWVHHAKR